MAWFGAKNNLSVEQLALGWGFALLEGAVMAAIKLVPIGQQSGQTLLRKLSAQLPEWNHRPPPCQDVCAGYPIQSEVSLFDVKSK